MPQLKKSTRAGKKYMVTFGNRTTHFGGAGYSDRTTTKDPVERKKKYTHMVRSASSRECSHEAHCRKEELASQPAVAVAVSVSSARPPARSSARSSARPQSTTARWR